MNIKNILTEKYGYSEQEAVLMASDLSVLDPQLIPIYERWMETGEEENSQEFNSYSIDSLRLEYGMNFFAAITTLDWIVKEPENALPALKQGMM